MDIETNQLFTSLTDMYGQLPANHMSGMVLSLDVHSTIGMCSDFLLNEYGYQIMSKCSFRLAQISKLMLKTNNKKGQDFFKL